MAQRTVFRDPSRGRFISEATANASESALRQVYLDDVLVAEQVLSFGVVQDVTVGELENWQQEESRWGTRWHADDDPLDLYGLQQAAFPEGYDSFKVWYHVEGNPDYPGGYATGRPAWLGADQWPPSLETSGNFTPTGIAQIVFRRD